MDPLKIAQNGAGCLRQPGKLLVDSVGERIFGGLLEAIQSSGPALVLNRIELHAIVSEVPLFLTKPPSGQGRIREHKVPNERNKKRDDALEDKEPFPARNVMTQTRGSFVSCFKPSMVPV